MSGVDSTRSMRSGLSAKALPLWRVTMIMAMSVRGCSSNAVSIRDVRTVLIDRAGLLRFTARNGPATGEPGQVTKPARQHGPGLLCGRAPPPRRGAALVGQRDYVASPLEVDQVLEDLVGGW